MVAEELQSFKNLMSLRTTTSSELIKDLIGYDPDTLASKIIRRAELKEKELFTKKKIWRLITGEKTVIFSSHGICYGVIISFFQNAKHILL